MCLFPISWVIWVFSTMPNIEAPKMNKLVLPLSSSPSPVDRKRCVHLKDEEIREVKSEEWDDATSHVRATPEPQTLAARSKTFLMSSCSYILGVFKIVVKHFFFPSQFIYSVGSWSCKWGVKPHPSTKFIDPNSCSYNWNLYGTLAPRVEA